MSYYVMSDIHGCYDEFIDMLKIINFSDHDILICAGDYIDRGKQSYEMLKWIENKHSNIILVKGNHEQEFVKNIDIMQIIATQFDKEYYDNNNTKKLYGIVKKLSDQNGSLFDYYETIWQMVRENNVSLNDLITWKTLINKMPFYYNFKINNRECVVVHAGYIESLDNVETEDKFDSLEDFYLYARDDAYIYGGKQHSIILSGHTPTIFFEEIPYNNGNVYHMYDNEMDCDFYNIDCGSAYRTVKKEAKLACIRIDDMKIFYR